MSGFDFDAYDQVFPHKEPAPEIESNVDTFKPTTAEMAKDNTPGDAAEEVQAPKVEEPTTSDNVPEGEPNG